MPVDLKPRTSFVVFRAGSAVADSSTSEGGHVNSTAQPERTVQAPSPSSSSSSEGSALTDDELGLAVGGGFMILVMLSILFVGHKRRMRMDKDVVPAPSPGTLEPSTRRSPEDPQELYVLDDSSFMSVSISFGSQVSCFLQEQALEEALDSWNRPEVLAVRICVSDIYLDDLVARGTNSEVYRGEYRGQVVAIKKPLPQWLGNRDNLDAFFDRVRLLASPALTHPGMVSFLGVSWRSLAYVCMVSEFMAGGDLRSFMSRRQHQVGLTRDDFARRGFCRQKVYLASQVANALSFLHAQGLIHGAISSQNVLLDENINAKLTKFQGSSIQPAIDCSRPSNDMTNTSIPPKLLAASVPIGMAERLRRERTRVDALWSAPEVLRGERSNAQSDIFSFGVVLSELDSLAAPYGYSNRFGEHGDSAELLEKIAAGHAHVHFASSRSRHGRRGSSPPAGVDARTTAAVVRLGKACVALDAFERPSAAQVSAELHKLLQALEKASQVVR